MAGALGVLHNATIDVEFGEASPPVVNTPREAAIARAAAEQLVGADRVVGQEYPSMGAEDFSYYLAAMPGCYVRFGTRPANGEYVPLHSPIFDLDEDVLEVGAAFYERVAREALRRYAAGGDERAATT
jgi:hippurate hydrolase